jgi:hypothetical protein
VDRKDDGITLPKRNDLDAVLHTRPLFGQDEFATHKILSRTRRGRAA